MTPARRVLGAGLVLVLLLTISFTVVAPPERCPAVSAGQLRASAQAAVDWFVRNQERDGSWLYLYDRDSDTVTAEYGEVRHAGVAMGLYQAAARGLPGALESADRGTAWAQQRLLRRHGWAAVPGVGRVTTGASALLVAGLAIRRQDTGDTGHDDLMRALGRFLVAQIEPSGAVLAKYDPVSGKPVAGEYSKYYTGETYWALASLHLAFPDEGWRRAADRVGAYLATSRDDVEDHWPPISDHWAAYGQSETVKAPERGDPPLTEHEADYARAQAELFGIQARLLAQGFGAFGSVVRAGSEPRGGWYGVIDEALTGWWLTAQADPRLADLRGPIAERATCVAGLAVEAQATGDDAADSHAPARVEGAWFRDGETRMDDQQHALAGLLRTIPIVEAQAGGGRSSSSVEAQAGGGGGNLPSAWLWAAALLLALNPVRAAFGVPRGGRSGREALGLAALGGALGGLFVCLAALLGDPLLDAVDVSDPSFRIAAGLVAVLAGGADLLRQPPPPEPALRGWRAALVPVAVPLVARPALVVLALSAGADRGATVSVCALVVGVALLTALSAAGAPDDRRRARVLRWAARLLGVGLVACGVLLAIDGVLSV